MIEVSLLFMLAINNEKSVTTNRYRDNDAFFSILEK